MSGRVISDREELARRQAELVRALVLDQPTPVGFDAARVGVASNALLRKRSGEVARRLPHARAQLGADFDHLFAQWARGRPRTSSTADAAAFAEHLTQHGHWSPPDAETDRRRRWWRR